MGPVEVGAGVVLGGARVEVAGVAVLVPGAAVEVGGGVTIGELAAACCGNNACFSAWITPRGLFCGNRTATMRSPTLTLAGLPIIGNGFGLWWVSRVARVRCQMHP